MLRSRSSRLPAANGLRPVTSAGSPPAVRPPSSRHALHFVHSAVARHADLDIPYGGFTLSRQPQFAGRQADVFRGETGTDRYSIVNLLASYV